MYLQGVTTFSLYILCAGSPNAAVRSQLGSAAARRLQQAALATIAFALRAAALRIYAVYTVYIPYTEGSIYCIQCGGRIPVRSVSARTGIRSGHPHCSHKAFSHRIRIQRSYAYFKPIPANLYLSATSWDFPGGSDVGSEVLEGIRSRGQNLSRRNMERCKLIHMPVPMQYSFTLACSPSAHPAGSLSHFTPSGPAHTGRMAAPCQ